MENVVALRRRGEGALLPPIRALVDLFASRRRGRHDAFWLKENAELLQILAALGAGSSADLEPLKLRADAMMSELRFFPQYYRMYLSLALDLRALGMTDAPVEEMATFILAQNLPAHETSDIHRGEVRLLLRRAGAALERDTGLEERLAAFARNSAAFCLPNRRAAYDLTHIVFHAADYGRRAIARDPARCKSLMHVGLVAWLEGNMDLLAEVTLALRLSGEAVPDLWAQAVKRAATAVSFEPARDAGTFDDDYHQYLVLNWALGAAGGESFAVPVPAQARLIRQPLRQGAALHELSFALLDMAGTRCAEWSRMRWRLWPRLSEPARTTLAAVETMPEFEGFFAAFARPDAGDAR